jgi:hypothetical protein
MNGEPTKCKIMKAYLQKLIACGLHITVQKAVSEAENPEDSVADAEQLNGVNEITDSQSKSFQE